MNLKSLNKILFVDDDIDILSIIKYTLESLEGVTVYTAINGPEGIEIARKESPDLIVLDVMMPNMDGCAVFKALRLLSNCVTTPIVFLTARVKENEMQDFITLGAVGVIIKPFDPFSLTKELIKLWEES